LSWVLATTYYPAEYKHWNQIEYWIAGTLTSVLLFGSVLLHELGHSIIAIKYKIKVNEINLFIFGGISEISGEPPKASSDFWIAIAGPIVSLLLAGVFFILEKDVHVFLLTALFEYLAFINFILVIFNLIPGFPLDGGRVFRAIIWGITKNYKKATNIAVAAGRLFGFLFILFGVYQIFGGNILNGLWISFIGWFLDNAAVSQLREQKVHDLLTGHKVFEAMSQDYGIVSHDSTLQEVVDNNFLGINRRALFVKKDNKIAGLITLHRFNIVARDQWNNTFVEDVMIPISNAEKTSADAEIWEAMTKLNSEGVNQLPVINEGEVEGIFSRDNAISFIAELRTHTNNGKV
ncbi:MAG: site-2 protease family protein, partial [Ignavibacteriaceae bacterium]